MRSLLYTFLVISFFAVSFCVTTGDIDDNDVNLDAINTIKYTEKVYKQKKLPSETNESREVAERQRLINYILNDSYDKRNYPTNMTVQLGVALLKVDIDERKSTFEADVWIKMGWSDKRLAWDTNEFDVSVLRMKSGEIWIPDTTLYNSATPFEMLKCSDTNTLIYPNGFVLWVPPCRLSAHCNLTLDRDPYGPQNCTLKFGSWTFDGISMDLQIYNNETQADVSNLYDSTQWNVVSNNFTREVKYYDCCTEPYVSITYNLGVQRKSAPKTVSCDL